MSNTEEETKKGKKTHVEMFQRFNEIEKHMGSIEGKLDILINK